LPRFRGTNANARHDRLLGLVKRLDSATGSLRNARTEVRTGGATPRFILTLASGFKMTGLAGCIALQNGTPSIHVDPSQAAGGIIGFSPACLRPEDPDPIGRRLRELIG